MDHRHHSRRRWLQQAAAGGVALGLGPRAFAQADWPRSPIRLVVPYAAGGVTDILARLLAKEVSTSLGQTVIIENRAGAGGTVGVAVVAKAPPDGYTVGIAGSSALIATPMLTPQVPFSVPGDFSFVSLCATVPMALTVASSMPVNNAQELLAYMRANAGKLSYGSTAVGHYGHVATMEMSESQKAGMVHSPYKGETPLMQDLLGGQIQVAFLAPSTAKPMVDAGKLKLLAVSGTKRLKPLPDLPTLVEQGLDAPVFRMNPGWLGILAPAKLPPEVAQRLSAAFAAAVRAPEVNERILQMGLDPVGSTGEQFLGTYQSERPVWRELLTKAGLEIKGN